MANLSDAAWVLIALIAAGAGVGALYALAVRMRDEIALHDLRLRTEQLRLAQKARLRALRSSEFGDVDFDDDTLLSIVAQTASAKKAA